MAERRKKVSSRRGFTLIEILVVIGIILLLMALIVPALSQFKKYALKSATQATMHALAQGLESYNADFTMYPPSQPSNAYGITNCRGSTLLAEALTGYLPYQLDGAGLDTSTGNYKLINGVSDPPYGFRIHAGVGKIYGPYVPTDDPKVLKVNTTTNEGVFLDKWGNEILYYRAVPAIIKSGTISTSDAIRTINDIFEHWTNYPTAPNGSFGGIFVVEDNAAAKNASGTAILDPANSSTSVGAGYWGSLGSSGVNAVNGGEVIVGADSYLLMSAGPDGVYFSNDDVIQVRQ